MAFRGIVIWKPFLLQENKLGPTGGFAGVASVGNTVLTASTDGTSWISLSQLAAPDPSVGGSAVLIGSQLRGQFPHVKTIQSFLYKTRQKVGLPFFFFINVDSIWVVSLLCRKKGFPEAPPVEKH